MKLRLAEPKDSLAILHWRNDPHSRAMSRDQKHIDEVSHNLWFEKLLQNPKRLLLIGEMMDEAVGMVRFDQLINGTTWEVSIALAPQFRGQGLSKKLLEKSLNYFHSKYSEAVILAEIKQSNVPSRKLFESLGFQYVSTQGDILCFSYEEAYA
ncbi:GNAT family N-acetyltransferase [Legionella jordanis]|uniref:N-Acyltransferase (NAT) n=1 Tax=Legionella jordanis TaxID=456 RepID=A0A0W0VFV1_9GAMM|nr:GNAT family N-acetyltransferase [Legionella jordanis]KTD18975.1 N-Acyltransferase (NAT) [Legionella jordanis]RMX05464.1 N-acetyltransferase [Legionella jordanis]RMX19149.1 N-acetyltransferase [Legionella jordanis]VEH13076.1 N-Acyltransferase (NAT) [Legionella jordanis]HAT8714118.1 GNAT family N-acetyltransferase [Legionella jordanis]